MDSLSRPVTTPAESATRLAPAAALAAVPPHFVATAASAAHAFVQTFATFSVERVEDSEP